MLGIMNTKKTRMNPPTPRKRRLRSSSRCSPMVMRYSSGSCFFVVAAAGALGAEGMGPFYAKGSGQTHRALRPVKSNVWPEGGGGGRGGGGWSARGDGRLPERGTHAQRVRGPGHIHSHPT